MKKPSWLTTLFGVLASLGTALSHYGSGTLAQVGMFVALGSTALLGASAQDSSNAPSQS